MKKITTLILAIVMIVSAFAVWAFAAEEENWNVDLTDGIFLNLYSDKTLKGTEEVAAKEMGVVKTIGTKSISVAEYANGLINDQQKNNRTQINLAQALLNYGAAAKAYWNYADGEITNGTPVTDYSALISAEYPAAVYEGANNYIGATLTLDAKMKLRLYFDSDAVLLDENGAEFTYYTHPTNGYIYIEEPITPKEIFKTFTYTCDGAVVSYSPVNYLKNVVMSEDASVELKNLVASIYAYGLVAEDYRDGGLIQLDHLQRTDIDTYEYDMSDLTEVIATVAYNSGADNANQFVNDSGKVTTYVIDITDTTFNSLSIELADHPYLRFAFLAEEPVLNQVVDYAEGYCTYKAAWSYNFTLDIPKDAKYFLMAKMDGSNDVTPKKMTFNKNDSSILDNLQNATTDTYSYPIENLVFDHGIIDDNWWNKDYYDHFVAHDDCKIAIIDITGCKYDYVSLAQDMTFVKQLGWTFLTDLPQWKQPVSYAGEYTGFKWGTDNIDGDGNKHTAYNIEIPEGANYLVLYYMESYFSDGDPLDNDWRYYPNSITFSKSSLEPDYFLKDETLDMYSYPMNTIAPANGSIFYWEDGHIYTQHDSYWAAFVPIDGTVFDYVTIGVKYNYVIWAFLTDMPEFGQSCEDLYAEGYTDFLYSNKGHSPNNIEIPDDAKYLVYYYQDDPNTLYYPSSLTFTKEPIDDPWFYYNNTIHNEFAYPMDDVVSAGGCVIYWDENGDNIDGDHLFLENAYNKGVGKYQCAVIELTDNPWKYVTITANGTKKAGWAFLSERPTEGNAVKYVGAKGFTWTSTTSSTTKNFSIPKGAKYLVVWYEEAGNGYRPASIIFHINKK